MVIYSGFIVIWLYHVLVRRIGMAALCSTLSWSASAGKFLEKIYFRTFEEVRGDGGGVSK